MSRAEPIGERVTRVEQRLERVEETLDRLMGKMDQLLEGQQKDRLDRKEMRSAIGVIKQEIAAMKPQTDTVARSKLWLSITSKIWLTLAAIGASAVAFWNWAQPYLKLPWPFGR